MRSRNYVPGVVVQGRGLRGPKGDPGDMIDATTYLQATSLMSDYADLTHTHGSVLGHNVTITSASDGMTLSVAALGAAANTLHAGNYISMDVVGPSSTISVTGLQSSGAYLTTSAGWDSAYLTTAARSTHIHGSVNITTIAGTDVTYSSASSGLTLGVPAFITTANETWHSHTDAMSISERPNYFYTSANTFANSTHIHGSINTAAIAGAVITNSSASSGLTLGIPNFLTTAAQVSHTHGGSTISGYNISGSSNSTGLTLSVGNAIALTNSTHFVNTTVSNSFVRSWELEGAHTAGTTGSLIGSAIYFSGGDNITLSGNSNTIIISGNAGAGGGVAIGNTATVPFTSGSVMFQGINVTITTSAGVGGDSTKQYINLSVDAPVTGALGAIGNTATSNKFGSGTVMFSGSNITVNLSSDGASQWVQLVAADPAAAANNVQTVAGGYISLSVDGVSTTVSATGVQASSLMTGYMKNGALVFSNTNGIYWGTTGVGSSTTVTAEFSSNLFFPEAYSSNLQAVSNSSLSLGVGYSTHTHGSNVSTVVTAGSDIKFSSSSNGLTAGIPAYLTTAAQSGHTHGNTSYTSNSTLYYPAITGGVGITSASNAWSISIPAYLTTAALSTHTHGANTFSFSNFSSSSTASASNGLTLGLTGYPATSFVNVSETGNIYFENGSGVSFGSTYSSLSTTITGSIDSGNIYFVNPDATSGSNMTFGSSTSGNSTSIYITAGGGSGAGGGAVSASNGSFTFDTLSLGSSILTFFTNASGVQGSYTVPASGTLSLIDGNGISFISSSDGSTTSISGSVETAYIGLNSSNSYMKSWAVYGNTSSQTSGIIYNGSLKIHASDNVTIRGASDGITFIGAGVSGAAGTGFSSTSTSGSVLTGTLNNSGMSFGVPAWITTAAQVVHDHTQFAGIISTGVTGLSATLDSTKILLNVPQGSVYYNDSNGIIFGASSSSLSTTITASITQSYVLSGNNSDTTAFTAGPNLTIIGSDNITIGANSDSQIYIIGASGGAGGGDWSVSTTSGTDVLITTGAATNTLYQPAFLTTAAGVSHSHGNPTLSLVNLSGATASGSNGFTASLTGLPAGTLSLINANGVTFLSSSDGSTTSVSASTGFRLSNFMHPDKHAIGSEFVNGSLSLKRMYVPYYVTGTAANVVLVIGGATQASATTASVNLSMRYGLYTLNGSTLSLASSGSTNNGFQWSQDASSTANSSVDGARLFPIALNMNLTPGEYWGALLIDSATTYTGITASLFIGASNDYVGGNVAPIGSATGIRSLVPYAGIYTATTAAFPASIGSAAINGTGVNRANFWNNIYNNTYC